jgi:hypothetical protein
MRPNTRYTFVLAVGCLMALPASLPLARSAGRDYSRCIHACNVTRTNCENRCTTDCAELYPNDAAQRRACGSACHEVCVSQEQDCKDVCRAIKNGESPQEP